MGVKLFKLEGEILTALCNDCKCCLADDTHCWQCHVTKSIDKLCGCNNCKSKIEDYVERVHRTAFNRLVKKVAAA